MEPNVQTFIGHLNIYHEKKTTYVNAVQNYHSVKALLMKNNEVRKVKTNDISYSNDDYVITHEGVMMYKNKSGNNELSGNYFISNKSFLGGNHSNVYVQHDLNDFYYDPSSNTKTTYEILDYAEKKTKYNVLRCDSYSKMMGKKYYGIDQNEDCYLINDFDDISATNTNIIDEEVFMNDNLLIYSKPTEDNTIVLYDISSDKYNTKANLSNYGYVDYDGSFYGLQDTTDICSTTFEEYRNICHTFGIRGGLSQDEETIKSDCIMNNDCDGYIKKNNNGFHIIDGTRYKNSDLLYNCDNSQNVFYHKKRSSTDKAHCAYDSSYVRTISHDDWKDISNGNTTVKQWSDLSLCGMEGLLHTNKVALDSASGEFETAFENMITSFNLLSTHELQILQETTDVNAEQMTQINQEYQEYIQRTKENEIKETIYKAQKEDSRILYQSTEYKTTIVALITIGLAIYTFRYMKK
tara:strand:- start:2131 stop:3525 length:1395 start_codon:yes stop_codon:yes gene_type:complete